MATYEVLVADVADDHSRVAPNDPTPEVRTVVCKVDAADEEAAAAETAWGHVWEAKYGVGHLPVELRVHVTTLSDP